MTWTMHWVTGRGSVLWRAISLTFIMLHNLNYSMQSLFDIYFGYITLADSRVRVYTPAYSDLWETITFASRDGQSIQNSVNEDNDGIVLVDLCRIPCPPPE
jgi:hypothetical protein